VAVKGSIGPLRSLLDKQFNPKDEEILKSKSHLALVKSQLPIIYTTNYDEIIERAFKLSDVPCQVITNIGDMAVIKPNETQVVKFHGNFADDNSLVLTESSYFERLEFDSALDIRFRSDILGKTLLFIGYSFNDINIRYMLYRLHKLRQKNNISEQLPTAIMTTFSPGEVQRTLLAQWGVLVVELDPVERDKSIDDFLEELLV
jgi:hypothetical protein